MNISLWLERLPPSTNALHKFGRGHAYSTPRYREWMVESVAAIKEKANGATVNGPFKVSITAARPDRRRRDLDNQIKPIMDALQAAGVIENDCHCELISARWATVGDGIAIRVEPAGIE